MDARVKFDTSPAPTAPGAALAEASARAAFDSLTVVVPTLDEAENVPRLLDRLAARYPGATVLFADDDSTDGTRDVARAWRGPLRVRVVHRQGGCTRGLTASVVDALKLVDTPHFAVMDADFQHPPEALAAIYKHASNGADLAVGRRVNYEPLTVGRRALSRGAGALTRGYLRTRGKPSVHDPMSGFFGGKTRFARAVLDRHEDRFEKGGFKVLVDFLRFAPSDAVVAEVPYRFGERAAGGSKMRPSHVVALLRQLGWAGKAAAAGFALATSPQFWKFAAVGLSGVAVNSALLFALHGVAGLPLLAASALAISGAIASNFALNDAWTFRDAPRGVSRPARLARFALHCSLGAALNVAVLHALVTFAEVHYLAANALGILAATLWNWGMARRWTWADGARAPSREAESAHAVESLGFKL